MIEVEVFGALAPLEWLTHGEVERLCALVLASAGVRDGHLAVEFVDAERIGELNAAYRGKEGPTDVLSFPIDGAELGDMTSNDAERAADADSDSSGEQVPRELGDIVICPECTIDLREAVVHGALHLVGMDHEIDEGQMLAVQAEILRWGAS
jgi:probable rRNA maturation factor